MEQLLVVCDECGKPAVTTVTFKMNGASTSLQRDLCRTHADAMKAGAHKAKRGRRSAVYA